MWLRNQSGRLLRAGSSDKGLVAALGSFDGMHIGHQAILKHAVSLAREKDLNTALISFSPHPAKILRADPPPQISSFRQKILNAADSGVENLITIRFTPELAKLEAEDFVSRYLFEKFNVEILVIGPFASLGRNRKGNPEWLKNYFREHGRQAEIIESFSIDGQRVSSGRIRKAISDSDLAVASRLLGRRFSVCSRVKDGNKTGRHLGFPTANLDIKDYVKPGYGVYSGFAILSGKRYKAAINFGRRPTLNKSDSVADSHELLEAHLLDYSGSEFYGQQLIVEFERKIRDEIKFSSLQELKKQIELDVQLLRSGLE